MTVMLDTAWAGLSDNEGSPLFDADGKPAPLLADALRFLERFDQELGNTREFCAWLQRLDLLEPMTAKVTLPNGTEFALNGFLTIDQAKLNALPDALVLELHRNGTLRLLNGLQLSLVNIRFLTERKARRSAAPDS
jgi:hypothetical protein